MTIPITPSLWFDGCALDAAETYVSTFPNSFIRTVTRVGFDHPSGMRPGAVLSVTFEIGGRTFLASNGGPEQRVNQSVSFQAHPETQEEVDEIWDGLLDGGGRPLESCWLVDAYGFSWQIVPQCYVDAIRKGDDVADRAINALLSMGKPDVAALKKAIAGE